MFICPSGGVIFGCAFLSPLFSSKWTLSVYIFSLGVYLCSLPPEWLFIWLTYSGYRCSIACFIYRSIQRCIACWIKCVFASQYPLCLSPASSACQTLLNPFSDKRWVEKNHKNTKNLREQLRRYPNASSKIQNYALKQLKQMLDTREDFQRLTHPSGGRTWELVSLLNFFSIFAGFIFGWFVWSRMIVFSGPLTLRGKAYRIKFNLKLDLYGLKVGKKKTPYPEYI